MNHKANTAATRRSALDSANPGDMVLFHHARGWNRIITRFFGARYYHVALYAGGQNVIESRVKGVSIRSVRQAKIRLYFEDDVLELDEVWSFVKRRKNKRWIWLALCRRTRQVVAFVIGCRGEKTCRRLWEAIPTQYKAAHCFADVWEAYTKVIETE